LGNTCCKKRRTNSSALTVQCFVRRRGFAALEQVLIFQFADALKNLAAFQQSQPR
jgi:hypothetical protein